VGKFQQMYSAEYLKEIMFVLDIFIHKITALSNADSASVFRNKYDIYCPGSVKWGYYLWSLAKIVELLGPRVHIRGLVQKFPD